MPVRRELSRSKDSLKGVLLSGSAAHVERKLKAEPRASIWDEDNVAEPDWEISPFDLDTYADIWSRD
jgi:hypothetical protein